MLTYRDMQIGMERVKDARQADAHRRQVEMVQVADGPTGSAVTRILAAVGGWLVREPAPERQVQATRMPAHKHE